MSLLTSAATKIYNCRGKELESELSSVEATGKIGREAISKLDGADGVCDSGQRSPIVQVGRGEEPEGEVGGAVEHEAD